MQVQTEKDLKRLTVQSSGKPMSPVESPKSLPYMNMNSPTSLFSAGSPELHGRLFRSSRHMPGSERAGMEWAAEHAFGWPSWRCETVIETYVGRQRFPHGF